MSQKIQPEHRRGRPRKPRQVVLPLGHSVDEYAARTRRSVATVWRRMKAGQIRYVQAESGVPRRIPVDQYIEEGFVRSLEELVEFLRLDGAGEQGNTVSDESASPGRS